jgi:hypothetical protein
MRTLIHAGIGAVGLVALLALPTVATSSANAGSAVAASVGGNGPEIGEVVNYKFRSPPMNSGGLTDLADLRGRPLLIEYWGTR